MELIDWGGIAGVLATIGFGCKWLITFIVKQANTANDMLKAENATLKDRIEILEIKLDARSRERD